MGPRPHTWICAHLTVCLTKNIKSIWVPALTCGFVHAKHIDFSTRKTSLCGPQTSLVDLCVQNSVHTTRISSLYMSQTSSEELCKQNRLLSTRLTYLYGSQTSPVDLCIQHFILSTRITSLYGSQHSSVVFACKTEALGPELQVSMGPRPHLWFYAQKQRA